MTENPTPPTDESRSMMLPIIIAGFVLMGLIMAASIMLTNPNSNPAQEANRAARVPENTNSGVGWTVPDVDITTLDGDVVQLSDYRGQIVFLNFWATWCVPCQREMPAFNEFMASGREDAVILAVNHGENADDVRDFVNLFQLDSLPILLDEDYVMTDGFGVMNLPVTYVIDGEGVVRTFKLGEVTLEDLEDYIAALS